MKRTTKIFTAVICSLTLLTAAVTVYAGDFKPLSAGVTDDCSTLDYAEKFGDARVYSLPDDQIEMAILFGDNAGLQRDNAANDADGAIYTVEAGTSIEALAYFWPNEVQESGFAHFKFYTSSDKNTWTEYTFPKNDITIFPQENWDTKKDIPVDPKNPEFRKWDKVGYKIAKIPDGHTYLKVEFPSDVGAGWGQILGEVKAIAAAAPVKTDEPKDGGTAPQTEDKGTTGNPKTGDASAALYIVTAAASAMTLLKNRKR